MTDLGRRDYRGRSFSLLTGVIFFVLVDLAVGRRKYLLFLFLDVKRNVFSYSLNGLHVVAVVKPRVYESLPV